MTEEEWTAQQCADDWGVKLKTWHSYVARSQAPAAKRHIGRTPVWDPETVRDYVRAGQGKRPEATKTTKEP